MGKLELNDNQDEVQASGGHGYILLYLDDRPSMRWRFYKSLKLKLVWEGTKDSADKAKASEKKKQPQSFRNSCPRITSHLDNYEMEVTPSFSQNKLCASSPTSQHFQSEISHDENCTPFSETTKSTTNTLFALASENNDNFDVASNGDVEESMCDKPEIDVKLNSFKSDCRDCVKPSSLNEEEDDHYRNLSCLIQCLKCQKEFFNQGELLIHQLQIHGWEFVTYHYPYFNFNNTSGDLNQHGLALNNCPLCREVFSGVASLTNHIASVHFCEEPYRCRACAVTKDSKSLLIEHLKTSHSTDKGLQQYVSINPVGLQIIKDSSVEETIDSDLIKTSPFDIGTYDAIRDQREKKQIIKTNIKMPKETFELQKSEKTRASGSRQTKPSTSKRPRVCALCKKPYWKVVDHYSCRPRKNVKCHICDRVCDSEAQVIVHKLLKHDKSIKTRDEVSKKSIPRHKIVSYCPFCGVKISYPGLVRHIKCQHTNETFFNCCLCKEEFSRWKTMQEHINTHLNIKNKRGKWHCSLCPEVFSNSNDFLQHSHCHRRICVFCNKDFKFLRLLNQHYYNEHYDSLLPCSVCGQRVATKKQLWTHERYHKYKNPVPCHICGKVLRHSRLSKHILRAHSHKNKTKTINNDKTFHKDKKYLCSMCPQTFFSEGFLIRHLNSTHKQRIGIQCPLCPKTFQSRDKAREHVRKHTLESKTNPN